MNNKPRVFVPHVPSRFDRPSGLWVPTINMQPAERHGELVILLPPEANRLHTAPLVQKMREAMDDFNEHDWLAAVGDPALIAAAACIAVRKTGGLLRMLKWDRLVSDYILVEVRV